MFAPPDAPLNEEQEFYEHFRIVADKGQSLLRVDKFLMTRLENASRNRIQNAIAAGSVRVNDKEIKPSYRVKPGDSISVVLPQPPRDTTVYPEDIPLDIVFEDSEVIIVNKPAGMVVHPGFNNYTGTLVNALAWHFEHLPQLPGNEGRPGLVHRIDKDTSGLLVISRNEYAMTWLAKQFFDHSIERNYLALVWGDLAEDGTVTGFIGRSARDRKIMDVYQEESKGKWAVTHYSVKERFGNVTLIGCRLETGRTHQIRAHMKSIGHPLFGDTVYGGDKILKGSQSGSYKKFVENCFEILPRQALHARTLGFIHPKTRSFIHFEAAVPADMTEVIEKWRGLKGQS